MLGLVLIIHFALFLVAKTSWLQRWAVSHAASIYQGKIEFEKIHPALLPLPHVVVSNGRLTDPGQFFLQFDQLIIYPKFWPLLVLKLKLGQVTLITPDMVVYGFNQKNALEKKRLPTSIRPDLRRIIDFLAKSSESVLPNRIKIKKGNFKLFGAHDKSTLRISDVSATVHFSSRDLQLNFKGKTSVTDQIAFEGQWHLKSLQGGGHLVIDALQVDHLMTELSVTNSHPILKLPLDLAIDFSNDGLKTLQMDFQGSAPSIMIQNNTTPVIFRELAFKGSSQWSNQEMQVQVKHIQTKAPQIDLNGQATWVTTDQFKPVPTELSLNARDLNLAEIRPVLLSLFEPSSILQAIFKILQEGVLPSWKVMLKPPASESTSVLDRLEMVLGLQNAKIVLPGQVMTIESVNGTAMWADGRILATNLEGRSANTVARSGTLILGLMNGSREFQLNTDVEADLVWVAQVLKKLVHDDTSLSFLNKFPEIKGRVAGNLKLGNHIDHLQADIKLEPGSQLDILDSAANITGTLAHLPSPETTMNLSIQGNWGPELTAWIENHFTTTKAYLPKVPITIRQARITGRPGYAVVLNSDWIFNDNVEMTLALKIGRGTFDLENLHLKDQFSDAWISLIRNQAGRSWQADFKGTLNSATLESLFQYPRSVMGQIQGRLKTQVDISDMQHTSLQGKLDLENIQIPLRDSTPLCIEKASLHGKENRFILENMDISLHDEIAQISGEGVFKSTGVHLNLALHAEDLNVDTILQWMDEAKSSETQTPNLPDGLTLSGNIDLAVDRLAIMGHRFSPVQAVVRLNPDQTTVEVITAQLCGISVPGHIRFKTNNIQLALKPHADQVILGDTGQCLYGLDITERLEGRVTLNGDISSAGKNRDELIHNLSGHIRLSINNGRVYNVGTAGTITNLLSYLSFNQLVHDGVPDLRTNDFPYNSMTSKLVLKNGVLSLEEGVLKSNSINIVASGELLMANQSLDLVLLVSPLTTVDWVVSHLPLVGHILDGTLIAVPVGIKGSLKNPAVLPLSPGAIGSRLGGILKRTLKTPFRIIEPLIKTEKSD